MHCTFIHEPFFSFFHKWKHFLTFKHERYLKTGFIKNSSSAIFIFLNLIQWLTLKAVREKLYCFKYRYTSLPAWMKLLLVPFGNPAYTGKEKYCGGIAEVDLPSVCKLYRTLEAYSGYLKKKSFAVFLPPRKAFTKALYLI